MKIKANTVRYCTFALLLLLPTAALAQSDDFKQSEDKLVRGVVQPLAQAVLVGELLARISEIPFEEGMAFKKGDALVKFDCTRQKARTAAAAATKNSARQNYNNTVELASYAAAGEHEVQLAEAELKRADAELKIQQSFDRECTLTAPYDGRIVKRHVNAHETPGQGVALLEIIDDSDFRLDLIVPSLWLAWLQPGNDFVFSIDETGLSYDATVVQIGAAVDPVSQTITVSGKFKSKPESVLSGMSGTAKFDQAGSLEASSES